MEPGIQSRHDQVDQQVDQDETEGGDHHHRLQHGDILVIHRLLGQLAEALRPKTVSVISAPAISSPSSSPAIFSAGSRAYP